jgi:hypothetical protein
VSSKEIAIRKLGVYAVQDYESVKRFYMLLGDKLPTMLLLRVGGRVAMNGDECDGITDLGKWEFCTQANTKNKAGMAADLERCPGRCVQILGVPKLGWMSGVEYLRMHGIEDAQAEFDALLEAAESMIPIDGQLRLPI